MFGFSLDFLWNFQGFRWDSFVGFFFRVGSSMVGVLIFSIVFLSSVLFGFSLVSLEFPWFRCFSLVFFGLSMVSLWFSRHFFAFSLFPAR